MSLDLLLTKVQKIKQKREINIWLKRRTICLGRRCRDRNFGSTLSHSFVKSIFARRVRYTEPILSSIIHYFENCRGAKHLEKVCLEFIVHEQGGVVTTASLFFFILKRIVARVWRLINQHRYGYLPTYRKYLFF